MTGPPALPHTSTPLGAGRRLFTAVTVVCLVLGTAGILLAWNNYTAGRAMAVEAVALRSQTVAANVYGSRISLVRLLQAVASDPSFADADPAVVRQRLDQLEVEQLGFTGGLAWLDRSGTAQVLTDGTAGVTVDEPWWREIVGGAQWTTSAALTSPLFTGEVIVFAVPTWGSTGTVNGVLAAGWSLDWVRAVAQRQATEIGSEFYGPDTDLLVVDRAGQLIVAPGLGTSRDVRDNDAYRRLTATPDDFDNGARVEPVGVDGQPDQIVGWTRIGAFGEYVILERPLARALAGPRRELATWIGGILLLATMALVSSGLAGRRIDRLIRERDRFHQAEHDVVADLHRWLLTQELPDGTVGRYLPAPSVLNAGGDWYDVVPLGEGRHALLVGDVVGHGVKAALAMGQLRIAARALATRVTGPGALLTELDSFVTAMPDVVFATSACVVVDPAAGLLRYASAGHPPPLLRHLDGTVSRLAATARPLGLGGGDRAEQSVPLAGGELVVLYTDGLVELPDEVIDEGIDRLAEAVATDAAGREDWAQQLIVEVRRGRPPADDIALLCFPVPRAAGTPARPTAQGRSAA